MRTPLRVLVVEDDSEQQHAIRETLRFHDPLVTACPARTLAGALARLADTAEHFDAVWLDLRLPDSPGELGSLEAIRRASPKVPVVVVSGVSDPDLETRALVAGAEDYLVKGSYDTPDALKALRHAAIRASVRRQFEPAFRSLDEAAAAAEKLKGIAPGPEGGT